VEDDTPGSEDRDDELTNEQLERLAKLRGYSLQRARTWVQWTISVDKTAQAQFLAAREEMDTALRSSGGGKLTVKEALSQALEQWASRQKKGP
jgi:hypothetical protein